MRRRWGTLQNFSLAFIDELEKQLLKKLLKWANFFLRKKKNTWKYHYFTPAYQNT